MYSAKLNRLTQMFIIFKNSLKYQYDADMILGCTLFNNLITQYLNTPKFHFFYSFYLINSLQTQKFYCRGIRSIIRIGGKYEKKCMYF